MNLENDKEFDTPTRRVPRELSTMKLQVDKEFETPTPPQAVNELSRCKKT